MNQHWIGKQSIKGSSTTGVKVYKFRFANHGTLESHHALVVPIGKLKLKIAIVPGMTPFLLSNTLFCAVGATIDTRQGLLHSSLLKRSIPIQVNSRGLYVLDLNELAKPCSDTSAESLADTFHVSETQKEPLVCESREDRPQTNQNSKTLEPQTNLTSKPSVRDLIDRFEEHSNRRIELRRPNRIRIESRTCQEAQFRSSPVRARVSTLVHL